MRDSTPQIVCVLGMHRSGTSSLARIVNLLGVPLGPEERLMKASKWNPKGFWEHQGIIGIDDEILARFGGTWGEPPRFPARWCEAPELDDLRDRARRLIAEDFAGVKVWGWKDPRTCLTLPFWQALLPPIRYLLSVRNPASVARSVEHTYPFEKGADLWLSYVAASIEHTAGCDRLILFYEELMENPSAEVARIARFLGVPPEAADAAVNDALAEELQHHRVTPAELLANPGVGFPAKALYLSLLLGAPRDEAPLPEAVQLFARHCREAHERDVTTPLRRVGGCERRLEEKGAMIERLHQVAMSLTDLPAKWGMPPTEWLRQMALHRVELDRIGSEAAAIESEVSRCREVAAREFPAASRCEAVRVRTEDLRNRIAGVEDHVAYQELVATVRDRICGAVPQTATVIVVSDGDDALLTLDGRSAFHFPRDEHGWHAGHHSADSADAIGHLETLRKDGGQFLVFPATAFWWLSHYEKFREYLDTRYRQVWKDEVAIIYELSAG